MARRGVPAGLHALARDHAARRRDRSPHVVGHCAPAPGGLLAATHGNVQRLPGGGRWSTRRARSGTSRSSAPPAACCGTRALALGDRAYRLPWVGRPHTRLRTAGVAVRAKDAGGGVLATSALRVTG